MAKLGLHHYVPRFYLARFVDATGKLWVFDKSVHRVFQAAPDKVAAENGFYNVRDLIPIREDAALMEKQLSGLESEVKNITENWLDLLQAHRKIEIPTVNRETIALFLTLQALRTAEYRAILVQFAQALQGLEHYDVERDAESLHAAIMWDEELVNKMSEKIADCIWIFAKNDSEQAFYTSDHPVSVKSGDNRQWLLGPRVFDEGMYVVYPLSPTWILYCYDRHAWGALARFDVSVSPVEFTTDMVNHENSGQFGRSHRFIFSNSPDFGFAREYLKDYPEHGEPDRKRVG